MNILFYLDFYFGQDGKQGTGTADRLTLLRLSVLIRFCLWSELSEFRQVTKKKTCCTEQLLAICKVKQNSMPHIQVNEVSKKRFPCCPNN